MFLDGIVDGWKNILLIFEQVMMIIMKNLDGIRKCFNNTLHKWYQTKR